MDRLLGWSGVSSGRSTGCCPRFGVSWTYPDHAGPPRAIAWPTVRSQRRCTRNGCPIPAVATLTYVYADSTAVVGPLAAFAEPHSYDLCEQHARGLTAPRGWDLVRHDGEFEAPPPSSDDLVALAEAVREAARPVPAAAGPHHGGVGDPADAVDDGHAPGRGIGRRGHLRVIPPSGG